MNHLKFCFVVQDLLENFVIWKRKPTLKFVVILESKFCWCEGLEICLVGWKFISMYLSLL
jgi:hypothetical protein